MKPDSFNGIVQSNRHSWIDYARGIAIFLVLYRHVFEGIKRSGLNTENYSFLEHANIIFFSFRMPLFLLSPASLLLKACKKGTKRIHSKQMAITIIPLHLMGGYTNQHSMAAWRLCKRPKIIQRLPVYFCAAKRNRPVLVPVCLV